jgi:hypothetical protein
MELAESFVLGLLRCAGAATAAAGECGRGPVVSHEKHKGVAAAQQLFCSFCPPTASCAQQQQQPSLIFLLAAACPLPIIHCRDAQSGKSAVKAAPVNTHGGGRSSIPSHHRTADPDSFPRRQQLAACARNMGF